MSTDEKSVNGKAEHGAKRHRSPSFPIIPIDDAITRLRVVFQHDKRAFTTAEAILSHLGYKGGVRSGTAGRVVSAIKQYGLLDEKSGQFRVSDLGFRILHLPEESEERTRLIKESALNPPLFQRVLAHYQGELPSDAALRSHLVLEEKFNPDSVEQFIRVFRETISIANPLPEDYSIGDESAEVGQATGGKPMQPSTGSAQGAASGAATVGDTRPPSKGVFEFTFPLSFQRNIRAEVRIYGETLKRRDLEVLRKKVADLEDAFEDEEESPPKVVTEQPSDEN
ncbi:MAG: hypothetical protein WBP93_05785 [Pyrinomonadaceae bacterium]